MFSAILNPFSAARNRFSGQDCRDGYGALRIFLLTSHQVFIILYAWEWQPVFVSDGARNV